MRVLASISAGAVEIFSGRLDICCDLGQGCTEWTGWLKLTRGEESGLALWLDEPVAVAIKGADHGQARLQKMHTRAGVHLPREMVAVVGIGPCPLLTGCAAGAS
jgi:hypothetical protein